MLQCSAHGTAELGVITDNAVEWTAPHRRIASGQSVVAYVDDLVVGGGLAGGLSPGSHNPAHTILLTQS